MSNVSDLQRLVGILRELGVRTLDDRLVDGQSGFPVTLSLEGGGSVVLDLPQPGFLSSLDADSLGVAVLDAMGYVRRAWGITKRISWFRPERSVLDSPLRALLEGSLEGGQGALYLDGYRYFSASVTTDEVNDVIILAVGAAEEKQARREASKSARMATALKRLGKALTMNQGSQPICGSAAHEIASAAELAAVLVWVAQEDEALELAASVGVNRQGQMVLAKLTAQNAPTCAAELVAGSRTPFSQRSVLDNVLTASLEAKFCYLRPGGVTAYPLVISDRLIGVLEMIGREGDAAFDDNAELFETVAEQVALALNSALMFEETEKFARRDALTGLDNHRHLHEVLNQRVVEARRSGAEIGLIMLDVDHFRSFNEEEGHDAGDEILKHVAEVLRSCLRGYDQAARYGGEEFTILLPGCSLANTHQKAEEIRAAIEAMPYLTRAGRERHVTVSLGCAAFPEAAPDGVTLIKAADSALFEAKRAGRNRVAVYDGAFDPREVPRGPDLARVPRWLPKGELAVAQERVAKFDLEIERIAAALHLSPSQVEILRALLLVAPRYRRLAAKGSPSIAKLEKAEEFRLLLPSLQTLDDRFDGEGDGGLKGARIPLLARILAVLLALEEDQGREIVDDPHKFDPEIVSLVLELRHAA